MATFQSITTSAAVPRATAPIRQTAVIIHRAANSITGGTFIGVNIAFPGEGLAGRRQPSGNRFPLLLLQNQFLKVTARGVLWPEATLGSYATTRKRLPDHVAALCARAALK